MFIADIRHEDEVQAATTSNKTELSRVTKDLESTKATLAQSKMSAESLNSQVSVVLIFVLLSRMTTAPETIACTDYCMDRAGLCGHAGTDLLNKHRSITL